MEQPAKQCMRMRPSALALTLALTLALSVGLNCPIVISLDTAALPLADTFV